jgi:hypothetical protein
MKLAGKVFDFGDQKLGKHLRDIADELSEQAYINGEDDPSLCEVQPLYDLSELLERLAAEAERLEELSR